MQYSATGEFFIKDVSLKGGVTITVLDPTPINTDELRASLNSALGTQDINVRQITELGEAKGFIIEAGVTEQQQQFIDDAIEVVGNYLGKKMEKDNYASEVVGSSLGESFFKGTMIALGIAFLLMARVVFLYFRVPVPSLAVILAALSDIVVTVAILNLLGLKISTAGIAALLMLIGYSVDTDILLSTRVLKKKEGSVMDRVMSSVQTGMTMTITTLVAIGVALFFTKSDVIREIMTILLIGLVIDVINTWIQNVGILRLYVERKNGKA